MLSQVMPSSSARFWAALAEGASPTTLPCPCSADQVRSRASIVVVFPAPAGPTSRSSCRPEVAMLATAAPCSRLSSRTRRSTRSTITGLTVGAVMASDRSSSRSSAASTSCEEYFTECLGRNTLVPSARVNAAGLRASSGGVSDTDCCWAASTTMPTTASRSSADAKRRCMVCRDASAIRFQCDHVDRLMLTCSTTARADPLDERQRDVVGPHRTGEVAPDHGRGPPRRVSCPDCGRRGRATRRSGQPATGSPSAAWSRASPARAVRRSSRSDGIRPCAAR